MFKFENFVPIEHPETASFDLHFDHFDVGKQGFKRDVSKGVHFIDPLVAFLYLILRERLLQPVLQVYNLLFIFTQVYGLIMVIIFILLAMGVQELNLLFY